MSDGPPRPALDPDEQGGAPPPHMTPTMQVLWYGHVTKLPAAGGHHGHPRVVFVTEEQLFLCMPQGGVTRAVPLATVAGLARGPGAVAEVAVRDAAAVVLGHPTPEERDQFLEHTVAAVNAVAASASPQGGASPGGLPWTSSAAPLRVADAAPRSEGPPAALRPPGVGQPSNVTPPVPPGLAQPGPAYPQQAPLTTAPPPPQYQHRAPQPGVAQQAMPPRSAWQAPQQPQQPPVAAAGPSPPPEDGGPGPHPRPEPPFRQALAGDALIASLSQPSSGLGSATPASAAPPAAARAGSASGAVPPAPPLGPAPPGSYPVSVSTPVAAFSSPGLSVTSAPGPPQPTQPTQPTPTSASSGRVALPPPPPQPRDFVERHATRERQLADLREALVGGAHVVEPAAVQELRQQVEAQQRVIEELRAAASTGEADGLRTELTHTRQLVADLQAAVQAQQDQFQAMRRAQDAERVESDRRRALESQVAALTLDRDRLRAELRVARASEKDKDKARAERETRHQEELDSVRRAFEEYDANVADYLATIASGAAAPPRIAAPPPPEPSPAPSPGRTFRRALDAHLESVASAPDAAALVSAQASAQPPAPRPGLLGASSSSGGADGGLFPPGFPRLPGDPPAARPRNAALL